MYARTRLVDAHLQSSLRFSISQMDVVPRQSYVSGIVPAEERTATLGITNIVRSLGAACGPLATGFLAAEKHFG
jgi:MFS family permease